MAVQVYDISSMQIIIIIAKINKFYHNETQFSQNHNETQISQNTVEVTNKMNNYITSDIFWLRF